MIDDITLVTGYKAHKLRRPGVKYVHNNDYSSSNMVKSLFCALDVYTDATKDLVVSYSDIIYSQDVLGTLLWSKSDDSDVVVVIHKQWLSLWQSRMEDPLSDAETLKVGADGYIKEIGKKPRHYDDIEGQYIGLMKFTSLETTPLVWIRSVASSTRDRESHEQGSLFANNSTRPT